eukprot:9416417-Pyramimonas_sp.AAC.1
MRRTLARPQSASVRARSHAAHSGALRTCFRACPLALGALWRASKAPPCVPARTRRILARPESVSVRARSHAVHSGARRTCFRACPLARGAPWRAQKAL